MALITTLATLKTAVADHLNRSDISTSSGGTMEVLIQLAEQRFQRDPRVREPGSNNSVLSSLMTTDPNWLLTAEPDIYLYGTLAEAAGYLRDYEALPVWEARLEGAIERLSGSVRLNPNRTALAVTSYAELQTLVADALNRGDMKNVIPVCIVLAERQLANDDRVRNRTSTTFAVDADNEAAPAGFRSVVSLYHDGTTYYGPLDIVDPEALPEFKTLYGATGAPRAAAVIEDNGSYTFRFAPVPNAAYSLKLVYWRTLTALASGTNWLYTNHPHIYVYATLAQCGPWVRGDANAEATVADARAQLEQALETLHLETWNRAFGGGTARRQFRPIGG